MIDTLNAKPGTVAENWDEDLLETLDFKSLHVIPVVARKSDIELILREHHPEGFEWLKGHISRFKERRSVQVAAPLSPFQGHRHQKAGSGAEFCFSSQVNGSLCLQNMCGDGGKKIEFLNRFFRETEGTTLTFDLQRKVVRIQIQA